MMFMKSFLVKSGTVFGSVMMSSMALAQEAATSSYAGQGLVAIGAALSVGLATFAAASSQGKTASAALESIGRNPGARDALNQPLILGLVFMEFQALLGFVIAIMWTLK
jgi:F-type H+-transporting ATPase subunit c